METIPLQWSVSFPVGVCFFSRGSKALQYRYRNSRSKRATIPATQWILVHSYVHPYIHTFIHYFTYWLIHSFVPSFITGRVERRVYFCTEGFPKSGVSNAMLKVCYVAQRQETVYLFAMVDSIRATVQLILGWWPSGRTIGLLQNTNPTSWKSSSHPPIHKR